VGVNRRVFEVELAAGRRLSFPSRSLFRALFVIFGFRAVRLLPFLRIPATFFHRVLRSYSRTLWPVIFYFPLQVFGVIATAAGR
jgi:hypothetical protein